MDGPQRNQEALTDRRVMARPKSAGIKEALRLVVKEATWWATARHVQGRKRDIFLFGTHRGGTTWLLQVLETQRGLRSLNEPYSIHQAGAVGPSVLPKTAGGQLISFPSPEAEASLRTYTEDLLSGRSVAGAPYQPWKRGYTFVSNRIVIKDLHTKALIDWFDTSFDLDIVYLTRHPIPQALSYVRNAWGVVAPAYLRDDAFADRLGADLISYAWKLLREGDPLERAVLNWVIENYVPLQLLPERPEWTFVSYEECVSDPEQTLQRLAERLQLDDVDAMRAKLAVPSRSSTMSTAETRTAIATGRGDAVVSRWRSDVDRATEARLLGILERFGIPLYVPGRDLPQPWWS